MLYVFHVEGGQMTTYDMNLTLQSVAHLKDAIERKTKIPSSSMVLLVSGGDVLQSDHMVSSYSAGTDTNPIYLFCKPSAQESLTYYPNSTEEDLNMKSILDGKSLLSAVEHCCSLPATVSTVTTCASLAQQFRELAHIATRSCEQLVHEQHLQHQGWAAVMANLEDIYKEFCERSRNFKVSFNNHCLKRDEYHDHLNGLKDVLESLGRIPMLPALQMNAKAHRFSAFDVVEDAEFEGNYYRITHPLDSSSENKTQDFGVEALKLSEEEVFENQPSTSKDVVPIGRKSASDLIEQSAGGIEFRAHSNESQDNTSLLHWILAQGNNASLQDIVDYCHKGLTLIDEEPQRVREEVFNNLLEQANVNILKHIKGIEDRLFGLDQLLNQARNLERDQHDQAASLIQCRDRLSSICDPSVLPTLVQSHCCQLEKLLKGHEELLSIRKRIVSSKLELCNILKARLHTVLVLENSMSVQDAHAMLSFQCLGRLERYFSLVAQLHRAPAAFVRAVKEAARRRIFSNAHLAWARDLANKMGKIHEEEVARRKEFNALFEGHFLRSLFPGMTDMPPAFATEAPPEYDARLPKLNEQDAQFVCEMFPELAADIPEYNMDAVVKFLEQRLKTFDVDTGDLADYDKDAESEAETCDFEKLSGKMTEKLKIDTSTTCAPETIAVSTVTEVGMLPVFDTETPAIPRPDEFENSEFYIEESLPSSIEWGRQGQQDNMDTHKINMEKLQQFLVLLCGLCKANIIFIKTELSKLKNDVEQQKELFRCKYLEILNVWLKSVEDNDLKFREQTQRLTLEHELELSDIKTTLTSKDDVINSLKKTIEDLKVEHKKDLERLEQEHQVTRDLLENAQHEIKASELKLAEFNTNKEKEIKDMQEKMHLDYKGEIESLRSRFRLVALTNMDRSPSESSLEKIERTDMIEISSHNAIVLHTKETAEQEKEEAVKQAIARCEEEWTKKFNDELSSFKSKYDTEKQGSINEVTRRLLSEKDRQLELSREREATLARECTKYRETIQQLTDPETNDYEGLIKCQLATLENEKAMLMQQIEALKKKEAEEKEEQKVKEGDSDGRSSPKKELSRKSRPRSHTPLGLLQGTLCLSSCMPGNTVFIMWDPSHFNYTVMQESPLMYFVHSDSLPALGLSITVKNESERRLYAIGIVESKPDYCYAKKSSNRYHMPNASRFYRVRVRPARPHPPPPCCGCDGRHKPHPDILKSGVLSVLGEKRPLKKWLTYMHAPDIQKSVDTSQSVSTTTEESSRVAEVATATLINLESPGSTSEAVSTASTCAAQASELLATDEKLDSIETSDQWQGSRIHTSSVATMVDMECSVGQCEIPTEPVELTVSALEVQVVRGVGFGGGVAAEIAQEATP